MITGPAVMVIERALVLLRPLRLATLKVMLSGPTPAAGVPEIIPLDELRVSPAGKEPEMIYQCREVSLRQRPGPENRGY